MTYQPAHVDGRTLVVIRRTTFGYEAIESGRLSHDGERLHLTDLIKEHEEIREVGDDELSEMKLVTAENRIPACQGFDFFRFAADPATH